MAKIGHCVKRGKIQYDGIIVLSFYTPNNVALNYIGIIVKNIRRK